MSPTLYQRSYPHLTERYGVGEFGNVLISRVLYSLSAGVTHSTQYALAAMFKAASDGGFNFLESLKEYGRRATSLKEIFAKQHIPHERYFTTPTPLNSWLWFVVAGNDTGYYVGFRSVFDSKPEMSFEYFPRNDSLLKQVNDHEDLQKLIRFSQQFYTVEKWNDTLVFNDLRFGQILGWQKPRERFVFHYFLQHPDENKLVVQRGRFTGWDWNAAKFLFNRIKGN